MPEVAVESTENIENEIVEEAAPVEAKPEEQPSPKDLKPAPTIAETWDKDSRYLPSWKKDPNNLYKSYREMEKVYPKTKAEVEKYNKLFKELGIEADKLPEVYKEYQSLKDPQAPHNQLNSYVSTWLTDPVYRPQVLEFFDALEKKALQAKYGEGLPEDVIRKLAEMDDFKRKTEEKEQKQIEESFYNEALSTIDAQDKLNADYAKKFDVEYTDETKKALLNYCHTNQIEPKYIHIVFKDFCQEAILNAKTTEAEAKAAEKLKRQRKAGVLISKGSTESKPAGSFRDTMKSIVSKFNLPKDKNIL